MSLTSYHNDIPYTFLGQYGYDLDDLGLIIMTFTNRVFHIIGEAGSSGTSNHLRPIDVTMRSDIHFGNVGERRNSQ